MRLTDYDYALPSERIAQLPIEPRDAAKLLVDLGPTGIVDRRVADIGEYLRPGDLLVVNDTKVIPARLALRRSSGGAAEVLLLEPIDQQRGRGEWEALVRPARKLKPGEQLFAPDGTALVEIGRRTAAGDTFRVTILGDDPWLLLNQYGAMPLPPYIASTIGEAGDVAAERYQTVYANEPGSAAAPTAGLHFTPALLAALASAGIETAAVELVVGLDTFQPIAVDDPRQHPMHSERYRVSADVIERCRAARRVVAVGTTATRALESAATFGELQGRTRLFIHRGYQWKTVDAMLTNFHLPRTTLLMMIEAFIGDRWRTLYEHALASDYRFLSFGDAMLLDRSL